MVPAHGKAKPGENAWCAQFCFVKYRDLDACIMEPGFQSAMIEKYDHHPDAVILLQAANQR